MVRRPKTYSVFYLQAIGDDGAETVLGKLVLPNSLSDVDIKDKLMDAYWDPRLDSASCIPRVFSI